MSEQHNLIKTLLEKHIDTWNNSATENRTTAIEGIYAENVKAADPFLKHKGREGISAMISDFQARFKGAKIMVVGDISIHHNGAYYKWEISVPGEKAVSSGVDFILMKDGFIKTLHIFIDKTEA